MIQPYSIGNMERRGWRHDHVGERHIQNTNVFFWEEEGFKVKKKQKGEKIKRTPC